MEKKHERSDRITVIVRCRPENTKELSSKDTRNIIQIYNEKTIIFDPSDPTVSKFGAMSLGKRNKHCIFEYDHVFDQMATQEQVYKISTAPLLTHALHGYNASVFAYGATGAGKTHTMVGNTECGPGVMILALKDLYTEIEKLQQTDLVKLSISYLEVYNELIRDLLSDSSSSIITESDESDIAKKNLELCEESGQVTIRGLSWHQPTCLEELLNLLEKGNTYRTRSPTDANALSSRSHAVLQIHIESKSHTDADTSAWKLGKLSLIDLAGSERASVSRNCGERQKEGANINRSLLALGNCINALCQNKKKSHVPYRDSKLTRLLKDSLGGSCKTVMIANISPSSLSYDDTHNTLKYADRAKNIKSKLKKNTSHSSAPQDQQEIASLRQKLAQTQIQLKDALQRQSLRIRDPQQCEEDYQNAKETFVGFQDQIERFFAELTKYKNEQQILNKTERKFVGQLHKIQAISDCEAQSAPLSVREIENQINEIHEQQKSLLHSIEKLNVAIRNVYQEVEENAALDETQRSYLHHDIQFHRTVIEKQDLVDLCSSKDCKLQIQQQRIQELEREVALVRVASRRSCIGPIVNPSISQSAPAREPAQKNIPARILKQSLSRNHPRSNSRNTKFNRARNSIRTFEPKQHQRTQTDQRKSKTTASSARPRFTFSSPPQSVHRKTSRSTITRTRNSKVSKTKAKSPKNEVENDSAPQTGINSLKITSLSNIGSPPRRVRNRKLKTKLVNKNASDNSENVPSQVNSDSPVPLTKSTTGPTSLALQLSALKEKRAAAIAKRKANTPQSIASTPLRPLQNSLAGNCATPLPTLNPGNLRKPSISLLHNASALNENRAD